MGEAGLHHGLLHGKLRALGVKPVELTAYTRFFALGQSKSAPCGQHGVAGRGIFWPGNTAIELIAVEADESGAGGLFDA
jgi:hypothetical protein